MNVINRGEKTIKNCISFFLNPSKIFIFCHLSDLYKGFDDNILYPTICLLSDWQFSNCLFCDFCSRVFLQHSVLLQAVCTHLGCMSFGYSLRNIFLFDQLYFSLFQIIGWLLLKINIPCSKAQNFQKINFISTIRYSHYGFKIYCQPWPRILACKLILFEPNKRVL